VNAISERCIPIALLSAFILCGCNGKPRINNDVETLDVCEQVTAAEAERVLGSVTRAPTAGANEPGFAGGCDWQFNANDAPARLSAWVMTKASASNLVTTPTRWFENEPRLGEAKANLGAPTRIRGVGDVAYLYGTTLFARQGETVLIVRTDRGNAAQVEDFARTLFSPKKK
jgi:hypothetical protein